jgi:hypothetical protein
MTTKKDVSLATLQEEDPTCTLSSPRSLQACKSEGVLPKELQFKGIEFFAEKNLSPRLVKLRYDFYEAKRKDLLAAARKAREQIIAEEKRQQENIQVDVLAKQSGLSKGAILALNSDNLKQERQKLLRAQEKERNWLKNQLRSELHQLRTLEHNDMKLKTESAADNSEMEEKARRMKELNDRRAAAEERKAMEAEARQKLEKEIAKQEFHKAQMELKRKSEIAAQKEKEAYQRQLRNAELKLEQEREKQRQREEAAQEQEAKKKTMQAQDLKRTDLMEQQKQQFNQAMAEKKEVRDLRIYRSMESNQEAERKRREEFELRQRNETLREERLAQMKALDQEGSAKKSFQLMMKRKIIQDEAARKAEDNRMSIIAEQEGKESRLLEHEQKKERYLDFKRELDGLRLKNKEINVERQRRKEEAHREHVADEVRRKDEKM